MISNLSSNKGRKFLPTVEVEFAFYFPVLPYGFVAIVSVTSAYIGRDRDPS